MIDDDVAGVIDDDVTGVIDDDVTGVIDDDVTGVIDGGDDGGDGDGAPDISSRPILISEIGAAILC